MEDGRSRYEEGAAWIGGRLRPIHEAALPVTDWGLTHSDAVYDVAAVWQGAFFRLDAHLDRFEASMAHARIAVPEGRDEIRAALHRIVAASGLSAAYVAMVASRGRPILPGDRDPRHCRSHFFAWCVPYVHVHGEDAAARGVRLHIPEDVRRIPETSVDPRAKNYHWGDFTRGLFEAKDRGFDSCLLLDHDGNVTEGPGFNVFMVRDGRLATPGTGCLEGITRDTVLGLAAAEGLAAEIRVVPLAELLEADEVFSATTAGGPVPVTEVAGRVFSNGAEGPVTARLRAAYWRAVMDPANREPVDYRAVGAAALA